MHIHLWLDLGLCLRNDLTIGVAPKTWARAARTTIDNRHTDVSWCSFSWRQRTKQNKKIISHFPFLFSIVTLVMRRGCHKLHAACLALLLKNGFDIVTGIKCWATQGHKRPTKLASIRKYRVKHTSIFCKDRVIKLITRTCPAHNARCTKNQLNIKFIICFLWISKQKSHALKKTTTLCFSWVKAGDDFCIHFSCIQNCAYLNNLNWRNCHLK